MRKNSTITGRPSPAEGDGIMEWIAWSVFTVIFTLACVIAGGVDDEPRNSIETKRFLANIGYLPLG